MAVSLNLAAQNGGSVNSARNGSSQSNWSWSGTDAITANANAAAAASLAYDRQRELQAEAMAFNAEEARKQREWETKMANTIYTRSVKNMKEAGINPILAASMGLSGAGVGSGATASISGASAPMGQSFMESSASGGGSGSSWGTSDGQSWTQSGLPTFLTSMGQMVQDVINGQNSSEQINATMEALGGTKSKGSGKDLMKNITENVQKILDNNKPKHSGGGGGAKF